MRLACSTAFGCIPCACCLKNESNETHLYSYVQDYEPNNPKTHEVMGDDMAHLFSFLSFICVMIISLKASALVVWIW